MARSRYRFFENTHPYFLTCSITAWLPVFARPHCVEIIFDSWKFLQDKGRMTLLGYVVMENHLHFIATGDDLSKEVGDFKSFTARRIVDHLKAIGDELLLNQLAWYKAAHKTDRDHQLWQEGSHPQKIETQAMMWQKLHYTHDNPIRRGYVDDPTHWKYSSARNYAGLSAFIDVCRDW